MWVGAEAQNSLFAAIVSAPALRVLFCCVLVPVEGLSVRVQLTETGCVIPSMKRLDVVVWRVASSVESREWMRLVMVESIRARKRW
jgi:hypothetical protein